MVAQDLQDRPAEGGGAFESRDRQEAIFREREGEILAKYSDKFVVVCGDELFVGNSYGEALSRAHAAHPGKPSFSSMRYPIVEPRQDPGVAGGAAADPAFEADLARQREIFGEREDELLAKNPGKSIAVCGGEVFVAGCDDDALSMAEEAHPDRAVHLCSYDPFYPCRCEEDAGEAGGARGGGAAADPAFEADLARQREIFGERKGELLAKNPGKSIAVCGGEVFVAGCDDDALSMAEEAHPDRAVHLCSRGGSFSSG